MADLQVLWNGEKTALFHGFSFGIREPHCRDEVGERTAEGSANNFCFLEKEECGGLISGYAGGVKCQNILLRGSHLTAYYRIIVYSNIVSVQLQKSEKLNSSIPQVRSEYVKVISTIRVTETNLTVIHVMTKTSL